jgi:hypothetical protein
MTCNIHPVERVVRSIVGIGLLVLVFVGPKTLWGLVGLVPMITGLTGYCPPYDWMGINTAGPAKK